jgi:predicted acetyltransferase
MEIVPLNPEHEQGLKDFLLDFKTAGETRIPAYFADPGWSHAEIVSRFAAWERGEALTSGWVPSTTRFLVDKGRILGVFNLRHRLNDHLRLTGGHIGYAVCPSARRRGCGTRLLEAAKEQARVMGIARLLLTCDETNAASRRVIERCGGRFWDTISHDETEGSTLRFWIDL